MMSLISLGILLWEIGECKVPFSEYDDIMELTASLQKGDTSLTFRQDTPHEWKKATLEGKLIATRLSIMLYRAAA